ncbi:MAG: hypothetical protein ACKOSS_11340 [Planctomycetia bacterium]
MAALRIVLLCIAAAVAYGLVHDQVTVRVCLAYFSEFHPPLVATHDPTLLALAWGVVATWWVGAGLGLLLALAARAGARPVLGARDLVRPVLRLLALMAGAALALGLVGAALAQAGTIWVAAPWDVRIPREQHVGFLACLWAHNASYGVGFVGGAVLALRTWRRRGRLAAAPQVASGA